MKTYISILIALLFIQVEKAVDLQDSDTKIGCHISNNGNLAPGFKGSVYYYPWLYYDPITSSSEPDYTLYTTNSYLSGGYVGDGSIIGSDHTVYTSPGVIANDVTASQINFDNFNFCDQNTNCPAELWKNLDYFTKSDTSSLKVPVTNFAFHMTGYIYVDFSGEYTIHIDNMGDLSIVNFGSNGYNSSNCCKNYSPAGDVSGINKIQTTWASNSEYRVNFAVLQLVAGIGYPIEFFHIHTGGLSKLQFSYTDPFGTTHYSLDGFIYHSILPISCDYIQKHFLNIELDTSIDETTLNSFTVLTQTNSYLTVSSATYTITLNQETIISYVAIPKVTTYWTGLVTSTSVSYLTTTDTNNLPLTNSVYYIMTPQKTTTKSWTGSYTATVLSSTAVAKYSGNNIESPIVVVETPYFRTTIPWNDTYTSTFTSDVVYTNDAGDLSTSRLVIVETPYFKTTVPWDNTYTTTYTSDVAFTNDAGDVSTYQIIFVETPYPRTTIPWNSSYTTTVTSDFFMTDDVGDVSTYQIIVVETPYSTTTIPWNNTFTTTFTSNIISTNDVGDTSTYQIVVVETPRYNPIPSWNKTDTTTIQWTNTFTSTIISDVVFTGTDGNPTKSPIIVVETPEYTTTKIWPSNITSTKVKTPNSTTISKASSTLQTTKSTKIPWSINSTAITTSSFKTPDSTITIPWTQTFTTTVTSVIVVTNTDGKLTTSKIAVVETPTAGKTITIPWTGHYTTTFTTNSIVTGSNNSTSIIQIVVVETPSFSGWNSTTLKTSSANDNSVLPSSIEEPSALITTAMNTEIMTVTCTEYGCLTKNQESSSSNSVDSKISPSSLNSDTSSITSNISSSGNSTPSIDLFTQEISSPSLVTTYNTNKANTLSFNGLAILLLQFI